MTADEFKRELEAQLKRAASSGASFVDVNSGELHRKVGGYPGSNHRMPVCCAVMKAEHRNGDAVVSSPEKGQGASLTIRYALPR